MDFQFGEHVFFPPIGGISTLKSIYSLLDQFYIFYWSSCARFTVMLNWALAHKLASTFTFTLFLSFCTNKSMHTAVYMQCCPCLM